MAKHKMDLHTAMDIADSADLPDGAYYAMIGDLMGVDYDEVMDLLLEDSDRHD